jgi:hypothetical protein
VVLYACLPEFKIPALPMLNFVIWYCKTTFVVGYVSAAIVIEAHSWSA